VQRNALKLAIALLVGATLVLALGGLAGSHGASMHGAAGAKSWNISEGYASVKLTGTTADTATIEVLQRALRTTDDRVLLTNASRPMTIQYSLANNTATVPFGKAWGSRAGMNKSCANKTAGSRSWGNKTAAWNRAGERHHKGLSDYGNASIQVAGANAVLAVKNITMVKKDKSGFELQYTDIAAYLPDGTVKAYKLKQPVRVIGSMDNRTATIIGSPEASADLTAALGGSQQFAANAPPIRLKDIDAKI